MRRSPIQMLLKWSVAIAAALSLFLWGRPAAHLLRASWAWAAAPQLQPFDSRPQRTMWPKIYGQVGPYAAHTEEELRDMARSGFHFALLNDRAAFSGGVEKYGISYIDTFPNWKMYTLCHPEILKTGRCSQATQDEIVAGVRERVTQNAGRDHMVGYWVLDDSPGADVRPLLRRIHAAIAAGNQGSAFARPTLCGFGDAKSTINFDPQACDIVAPYIYTTKDQFPKDWSVQARLPEVLDALRARGWNQTTTPLMGILQTFGNFEGLPWALPTPGNIRDAAQTYCRAGAIALLAYAWHVGTELSGASLRNTPSLVRGLQEAQRLCRDRYWQST